MGGVHTRRLALPGRWQWDRRRRFSILMGATLGQAWHRAIGSPNSAAMATAVLVAFIGVLAWLFRWQHRQFHLRDRSQWFQSRAGLVIISTQLPKLFGLRTGAATFFNRVVQLATDLGQNEPADSRHRSGGTRASDFGRMAFAATASRIVRCRALHRVHVGDAGGWTRSGRLLAQLQLDCPHLRWPLVAWNEVDDLFALALGCFVLAYVEGISVARSFALKHGYEINADQELLALGVTNSPRVWDTDIRWRGGCLNLP